MKKYILRALAMRRPNDDFVQAPSKMRAGQTVTEDELEEKFSRGTSSVSFHEDGVSAPQRVTTWQQNGGGGRYIVDSDLPPGYRSD